MSRLPLSLLLLLALGAPAAGTTPGTAEHLIVTPAAFVPAFEVLATHRSDTGVPSAVVSLESVLAASPGRDDAEKLRNYLVGLHAAGPLRYLLLGGDSQEMPTRFVRNTFYPPASYTDLACDQYYACLDGDWDGDGDGIFGEVYLSSGDPGDDVDLDPELRVGRAPVATLAEAQRFVDGVLNYDGLENAPHFGSALLMANVLFPHPWDGGTIQLDGAFYTEQVRAALETHPSPILSQRLYQNWTDFPGSSELDRASSLAALESGQHGTVFISSHGFHEELVVGSELLLLADFSALGNVPHYNLAVLQWSNAGNFATDCMAEGLVTAPAGGSAAVLAFTEAVFPSMSGNHIMGFFNHLVTASAVPVGDAVRAALLPHVPNTFLNTAERWTAMTIVLLGDPAMPFRSEADPVPVETISMGKLRSLFRKHD